MSLDRNMMTVTIDNRVINVERGLTILQAAERNDIYIPTLCAHKDLTPFGGCRMCIVEVEKMRGFPTSCTTPVEDGMIVRTQTAQLQAERMEILRLILSEHPSSCLVCDEQDECKEYSGTIRKVGVTTGCRYCPNDGQCELHDVAEKMGIKEIGYPVYYRGFPVKKDDPFFDRDYNLCILCGRCVRMCQEIRTANTLAFKQRGREVVIGPAYDRSHIDAGCEFCGACVSVCPTGALSEKTRKWKGKADREVVTTCTLCGVGCQVRLLAKENEVIGSLPADDTVINDGQLCVKGRFCVSELVNTHHRVKQPYRVDNGTHVHVSWNQAIDQAAEKLSACPPDKFAMIVSPNCTNEDLYIAQKFTRAVMKSHHIDSSARAYYGPGFGAYVNLLKMGGSLTDLRNASHILCIGLDTRFGRSVMGVELRKAIRRGAKIITVNDRKHNLAQVAETWLRPAPKDVADILDDLARLTEAKDTGTSRARPAVKVRNMTEEVSRVAKTLVEAAAPVILVGSDFLCRDDSTQILKSIEKIAKNIYAMILPLPSQNNLAGSILMGAYTELLPGGISSTDKGRLDLLRKKWGIPIPDFSNRPGKRAVSAAKALDVMYLVGELPTKQSSPADFIIYQNLYPPDSAHKVDLVLPAASFGEIDGTFINGEGRIQRVRKVVEPQGDALPDWQILCRIAQKMGVPGFEYSDASAIYREISDLVDGFGDFTCSGREARRLPFEVEIMGSPAVPHRAKATRKEYPYLLYTSPPEHAYRGFPLTAWVEGLRALSGEEIVDINSEDAAKGNISNGDGLVVTSPDFEQVCQARVLDEQPKGTLHVALRPGDSIGGNPHPAKIRKHNV